MKSASSPVFIRMNFMTESTRAGGESQKYEPNCPTIEGDDEDGGSGKPEVEWRPPEVGRQQTARCGRVNGGKWRQSASESAELLLGRRRRNWFSLVCGVVCLSECPATPEGQPEHTDTLPSSISQPVLSSSK